MEKKLLVYMVGDGTYKAYVKYPECNHDKEEELDYPGELLMKVFPYDQIIVVGTEKAKSRHEDKLREKFEGKMKFITIKTLGERKSTEAEEFWETFATVYEGLRELCEDDEAREWKVDLDLTTGIRIDQMLVQESVRFFCDLYENWNLNKLHYGYFERATAKKSPSPQAEGKSDSLGITTYFDSTSLGDFASMARSIHVFLNYNQASELVKILKMAEENKNLKEYSGSFQSIREDVERFSHVVAMNITPSAADVIQRLCQSVECLSAEEVRKKAGRLYPFVLAMKHLTSQLQQFLPEDSNPLWRWQKSLCLWCLERNLFQQAATQAEELVTTRVIEECATRNELTEEEIRSSALDYKNVRDSFGKAIIQIARKCKDKSAYMNQLYQRIDPECETSIVRIRNNVNHAYMKKIGCGGEVDIKLEVENLKECVKELLAVLEEVPSDSFLDDVEKRWMKIAEEEKKKIKKTTLYDAIHLKLNGSTSLANSNG